MEGFGVCGSLTCGRGNPLLGESENPDFAKVPILDI